MQDSNLRFSAPKADDLNRASLISEIFRWHSLVMRLDYI